VNDHEAPGMMRAAVLNEYVGGAGLVVQDVPRPVPEAGEVLIETVTGFWLTRWLPEKSTLQNLRLWRKVQRLIGAELGSEIRDTYPLDSMGDAVSDYGAAMSAGKVLIIPGGSG